MRDVEDQVERPNPERFPQVISIAGFHEYFHLGKLATETGKDPGQHITAETWAGANANHAGRFELPVGSRLNRGVASIEDVLEVGTDRFAGLGEAERAIVLFI